MPAGSVQVVVGIPRRGPIRAHGPRRGPAEGGGRPLRHEEGSFGSVAHMRFWLARGFDSVVRPGTLDLWMRLWICG